MKRKTIPWAFEGYTRSAEWVDECINCSDDSWETTHSHHTTDSQTESQTMTQHTSGEHSAGRKNEDGEWICTACGGESFDLELFEQFGRDNGCLVKGGGKTGDPLVHMSDVQRAQKYIEDAKNAMTDLGDATKSGSPDDGRDDGSVPSSSGPDEEYTKAVEDLLGIVSTSAVGTSGPVGEKGPEGSRGPGHWEEGDEIVSKSADGSIVSVHKEPDRWVPDSKKYEEYMMYGDDIKSTLPHYATTRGGITYSKKDAGLTMDMHDGLFGTPKSKAEVTGIKFEKNESHSFWKDFKRTFGRNRT